MLRHRLFLICLLGLIAASFATMAFGQDPAAVADPVVDWAARIETLLTTWLPRLVMLATALTVVFPSTNKFMRLVDVAAGAWGRARVDPLAQIRKS